MSFSKLKSVLAQMMVIYIVIKWIGLLMFVTVAGVKFMNSFTLCPFSTNLF